VHLATLDELIELGRPLGQHLHPALAEVGDAERQDLANLLGGGRFGHRNQRDLVRFPFGLGGGGGDALADLVEFLSQRRSFGSSHARTPSRTGDSR